MYIYAVIRNRARAVMAIITRDAEAVAWIPSECEKEREVEMIF